MTVSVLTESFDVCLPGQRLCRILTAEYISLLFILDIKPIHDPGFHAKVVDLIVSLFIPGQKRVLSKGKSGVGKRIATWKTKGILTIELRPVIVSILN
jgi:hypothetical protein